MGLIRGLVIGASVLALYAAAPAFAEEAPKPKIMLGYEAVSLNFLELAAKKLKEGDRLSSICSMDILLGNDLPDYRYVPVEEVADTVEDVVDYFIGTDKFRDPLMDLAQEVYRLEKLELAKDIAKEEMLEAEKAGGASNFLYHFYMSYVYTIDKTGSIGETHRMLSEYYHENFVTDQDIWMTGEGYLRRNYSRIADSLLEDIESKIPGDDSPLMKRIQQAYE